MNEESKQSANNARQKGSSSTAYNTLKSSNDSGEPSHSDSDSDFDWFQLEECKERQQCNSALSRGAGYVKMRKLSDAV